jgi:hypothetical protein
MLQIQSRYKIRRVIVWMLCTKKMILGMQTRFFLTVLFLSAPKLVLENRGGESGRDNDVSCSSEDRQSASETENVSE